VQRDERGLREVVRPVPVATEQVGTSAHGFSPSLEVLPKLPLVALIHADALRSLPYMFLTYRPASTVAWIADEIYATARAPGSG
jgi:hypothetical protein